MFGSFFSKMAEQTFFSVFLREHANGRKQNFTEFKILVRAGSHHEWLSKREVGCNHFSFLFQTQIWREQKALLPRQSGTSALEKANTNTSENFLMPLTFQHFTLYCTTLRTESNSVLPIWFIYLLTQRQVRRRKTRKFPEWKFFSLTLSLPWNSRRDENETIKKWNVREKL